MGERPGIERLLELFTEGKVAAAARLITILEDGGEDAERVLDSVFHKTGTAYRLSLIHI